MIFYSEDININCQRLLKYNEAYITYIYNNTPYEGAYHILKNQLHSLVNSGEWFFYYKSGWDTFGTTTSPGEITPRCEYSMLPGRSFLWFRVSESGITRKSVFLAFQTQKESPNFKPYSLLDQANNLLRLLGGVRSTDDDEQSSELFQGVWGPFLSPSESKQY